VKIEIYKYGRDDMGAIADNRESKKKNKKEREKEKIMLS
jgi:hypothetical protein